MNISKFNYYGELEVTKSDLQFKMPVHRFNSEDLEQIETWYGDKAKALGYSSHFAIANSITEMRNYFIFQFELKGFASFLTIRNIAFEEQVLLLKKLTDIAIDAEAHQTKILWHQNNFYIDMNENQVQALLFEFKGMDIYSSKRALEGLKEMILFAVTNLKNTLVKKPSKIDFIEKREDAYQLVEDILKANTLEDVQKVMVSELEAIDLRREREFAAAQERKANSKLAIMTSKFKKDTPNAEAKQKSTRPSISDQIKAKLKEDYLKTGSSGGSKVKEKKPVMERIASPVGISILIPAVILLMVFYYATDGFESIFADDETALAQEAHTDEVRDIYLTYLNGDKEKAYAELDSIGYENLQEKDAAKLIDWYVEQEQYVKAISTEPLAAYDIGDYIIGKNESREDAKTEMETLASQTESQVLDFDLATLNSNYESVIANNDLEQYNQRRANETALAYYATNNPDDLQQLIEQKKSEEEEQENTDENRDSVLLNDADMFVSSKYDQVTTLDEKIAEQKETVQSEEDRLNKVKEDEDAGDTDVEDAEKNVEDANNQLENSQKERYSLINEIRTMDQ